MEEASIMQQTGAKLRHFRVLKGISQEQLALDCDLNVNTIGMIERGQKNATIFTLKRICDGLGITLATLFLYNGSADTAEEETIQHIEAVLRQMPRRDVERVARIVEELASPNGHVIDTAPQTVFISGKEQDVVQLYFGNSPKGSLLIKKIDSETHEPLSDVEFMITTADGTVVCP